MMNSENLLGRNNLIKAALLVSMAIAPNEKLTKQGFIENGSLYLMEMGFLDKQHITILHTDK